MASTIGVVVAAYNAEQLIDQALASLAAQSRPPDEVIVIDDCSTDGTSARAALWSERLPLRVLKTQSNSGGPGPVRNVGIAELSTDYVAALDSDDVLLPDHLAVLERRMKPGKYAVSPSGWFWTPGESLVDFYESTRLSLSPTNQLQQLVVRNRLLVSTMFRRADWEQVGGYRKVFNEDWDLWTRLSVSGVTFEIEPIRTFLYRRHAGTMTSDPAVVTQMDAQAFERAVEVALPVLGADVIERCRAERTRLVVSDQVRMLVDSGDFASARALARTVDSGGELGLWLTGHLPASVSGALRSAKRRFRA